MHKAEGKYKLKPRDLVRTKEKSFEVYLYDDALSDRSVFIGTFRGHELATVIAIVHVDNLSVKEATLLLTIGGILGWCYGEHVEPVSEKC